MALAVAALGCRGSVTIDGGQCVKNPIPGLTITGPWEVWLMSSIWGNALRVSLFGQSHGAAVGAVLDGFPAGVRFDMDAVEEQMRRRRPGGQLATPRSEPDIPRILSGVMDGVSTGAPIAVIIENTDTRPADYRAFLETPRPSHADYTAGVRYGGFQDFRGGGHFSARLRPVGVCRGFMPPVSRA